jgi:hypothetical protein
MAAVAAMLDERQRWSSKGTFLQLPAMSHQKIRPVDPGLGEKNQWKPNPRWWASQPYLMSGGADHRKEPSCSHPNKPQKNRMNQPRRLSFNQWKLNPRWQP